jgi:hypothetical protein
MVGGIAAMLGAMYSTKDEAAEKFSCFCAELLACTWRGKDGMKLLRCGSESEDRV